jgi:NADP-dependent 3-hydroxy acid dehydrogenase YdfG
MSDYRTAVVTGATRGIGAATVEQLAGRGLDVVAVGRSADALKDLASRFGCKTIALDIADVDAVTEALSPIEADIVVNNAGVMTQAAPFAELGLTELHRSIDVNLKGTLAVTRALLPGMIRRQRGHLFFITSMFGPYAAPNASVYAATKAGIRAFASCLRLELAGTRVRVTEIAPGRVHTGFFRPAFKDDDAAMEKTLFDEYAALNPEDVATALVGALSLPLHVDINRIEITSTDQAMGGIVYAKKAR